MVLSRTEYRNLDATGLAELIRNGEVCAREAVDAALTEIGKQNPN